MLDFFLATFFLSLTGLVSFLKINVFYIHSLFRNVFNIHTFNTKILNTSMKNTVSTQVLNCFFWVIQSILAYFSTFLDACFFNCSFKIPCKSIFDSFRFFGSTKIYEMRLVLKNQKLKIDSCIIFHPDSNSKFLRANPINYGMRGGVFWPIICFVSLKSDQNS